MNLRLFLAWCAFFSLSVSAQERLPIPNKLVVLTFDDSNKSDRTFVADLLKEHEFGATFYATEGLGFLKSKEHYTTWQEIRELHDMGFEIGNHTQHHRNVTTLSAEAFEASLTHIDKRCREHGIPKPTTFCFPGFSHGLDAVKVLDTHGFQFARRGIRPEYIDGGHGGRGPVYDPGKDHPLLVPTTWYAGPDSGIEDLKWAVEQAHSGKITVLCYHGIPALEHPWVNTPQEEFRQQLQYLKDQGCTVIAMRDLARYVDPNKRPADPYAIINERVATKASKKPSVILMAIDDLNDWVGCLGGHPQARTPHIDRLAKRGTLFTNAHCQAPICNPSRTSIMYGLRPSTTGVYLNKPKPWTVPTLKNGVTLPRHFAAHGYRTYTTGKIYHGSALPKGEFEVVGPRPGQRLRMDQRLVPETKEGAKGLWDFGGQAYDETRFQDHADTTWAIGQIKKHQQTHTNTPFFMAIGFYRPHVPFYAPKRIIDEMPLEKIKLPSVIADDRSDLPAIVDQLTIAPAAPSHQWFVDSGRWKEAVRAYLACVRWTDEQVGRLMSAAGPDTIIVLYSDHGFFLGEKQRWAKQSLWERATRVPFIINAPRYSNRKPCARPVELLSIYPTLIELCGLTPKPELEGLSLMPLLEDSQSSWSSHAVTTHGKDNHAVRSDTHRYIRYRDGSEELYDLVNDPNEWENLAGRSEFNHLKAALAKSIPADNAQPATRVAHDNEEGVKPSKQESCQDHD